MNEPTQPTSSTARRRSQAQEIATEWGVFYATCGHPDRVRFSTNLTVAGGESHLVINRVRYSCSVELTRGEIPDMRRRSAYRRVDDTWHSDSAWYTFRRFGERGDATDNARHVLYEQVLPALAEWLGTDGARALMEQGAAQWRTECQRRADGAERMLSRAFRKVQDLRQAVAAGRTLSETEEQFLRMPTLQREDLPTAST